MTRPGTTEMRHAGRTITLRAPASQELQLQGTGALQLVWEPLDRDAQDLELRARLVDTKMPVGEVPVVQWKCETAHGDAVWSEPQPQFRSGLAAGILVDEFTLPARGMSWRVNAREFRISISAQPSLSEEPVEPTQSVVKVSILPGWGANAPIYPYQQLVRANGKGKVFPITSREWRLMDFHGLPLAVGAILVRFLAVNSTVIGPIAGVDAALFGDFRPVPHDAASFQVDFTCYAAYR